MNFSFGGDYLRWENGIATNPSLIIRHDGASDGWFSLSNASITFTDLIEGPDLSKINTYSSSNSTIGIYQDVSKDLRVFGGLSASFVLAGFLDGDQSRTYGQLWNDIIFLGGTFDVASPVPLPAALPLFASVLGLGGFLGYRRKRKAAMAAT